MDTAALEEVMTHPDWRDHASMLLVPAVHGRTVRLFAQGKMWYIATNHRVEPLVAAGGGGDKPAPLLSTVGTLFRSCLARYYPSNLAKFVGELGPSGMCWFFAMFPDRQALLFLGTCPQVPLHTLRASTVPQHLDLSFRVHAYLPPAIPLLPEAMPNGSRLRMLRERLHSLHTLNYTDLYDGLFVANTQTMFAVRLCYPTIIYLTPVLKHQQPLREFLALRIAQASLMDATLSTVDHATYQWLTTLPQGCVVGCTDTPLTADEMTEVYFGEHHGTLIDQVRWQVQHIMHWLPTWLSYVSTMCWDEWTVLDGDLQRLYLLLDYEHPNAWYHKILCNAKYTGWIAKVVVFCLQQWDATGCGEALLAPAPTSTSTPATDDDDDADDNDHPEEPRQT